MKKNGSGNGYESLNTAGIRDISGKRGVGTGWSTPSEPTKRTGLGSSASGQPNKAGLGSHTLGSMNNSESRSDKPEDWLAARLGRVPLGKEALNESRAKYDEPVSKNLIDKKEFEAAAAKSKRSGSKKRGTKELDTHAVENARGISHEEKRRRQNRRDAMQILVSFVLIFAAIGLLLAIFKLTSVNKIVITGSKRYSSAQIMNLSGIQKGENIFLYDLDGLTSNIDAIPELSVVSIRRLFPSSLEIIVADHDAHAAVSAANGTYTLIDMDGFVLSTGQKDARELPVINGLTGIGFAPNTYITGEVLNVRTASALALLKATAESSLAGHVLCIDVTTSSYITLKLESDFTIVLGGNEHAVDNIPTAAKAYALFLSQYPKGGIINVFYGTTIVDFTPNGLPDTTRAPAVTIIPLPNASPSDMPADSSNAPNPTDGSAAAPETPFGSPTSDAGSGSNIPETPAFGSPVPETPVFGSPVPNAPGV